MPKKRLKQRRLQRDWDGSSRSSPAFAARTINSIVGTKAGFPLPTIVAVAAALDKIPGGRFAGITTFPALLFDAANRTFKPTPNLETLRQASETLARFGYKDIEINAPGTTSSVTLEALAEAGATQVEPGHGLTGTTPSACGRRPA